jgi:hypothetical protein
MPQLTGALLPEGAVVEVVIGLDRREIQTLRSALRPVPQPRQLRALIDSGADLCCLDPAIVKALALIWDSSLPTNMPAVTGLTFSSLYRAGVTILHPSGQHFVAPDMIVCELPLGVLGYDALIGRDILDLLRFTYDGPARAFALEWT